MGRALPAVCLTVLVVLSGCAGVFGGGGATPTDEATPTDGTTATATSTATETTASTPTGTTTPTESGSTTETVTETESATETGTPTDAGDGSDAGRADPDSDRIGWENGYWYDDPIAVDATDGLNDSEFAAAKARTMARVELIRDREFGSEVSVEFITRETLLERGVFSFEYRPARDQFWEAAFAVGENRTAAAALDDLFSVVVDGYASGTEIVVVAEHPDSPRLDPAVLSHEMAHALGGPELEPDSPIATYDDRVALRSVFEGNANFVEGRYLARCESDWDCIERPPNASAVANFGDVNLELFLWFAAPYTIGPPFMETMYDRGGTEAIDEAYRTVPASTELFIHPEKYPGDRPEDVPLRDRSSEEWSEVRGPRDERSDEFGEAILYATLKANDVVGGPEPEINKAQRTGLSYSAPPTEGWEGDTFVVYRDGEEYGYAFASAWESTADATEFRRAWVDLLETHGATAVDGRDGVYRIPDGPFADAFRVLQRGDRVVVVNAPTVEELDAVHDLE